MQDRLREQWHSRMGHACTPPPAILNAQSTRTSPQGGDSGFDAGKKVKGRKRNLVVDTIGLVIALTVTAAGVQDRDAAAAVVAQAYARAPGLEELYTDGAYGGKCACDIEQTHHIRVEVGGIPKTVPLAHCSTLRNRLRRRQKWTQDLSSYQSAG